MSFLLFLTMEVTSSIALIIFFLLPRFWKKNIDPHQTKCKQKICKWGVIPNFQEFLFCWLIIRSWFIRKVLIWIKYNINDNWFKIQLQWLVNFKIQKTLFPVLISIKEQHILNNYYEVLVDMYNSVSFVCIFSCFGCKL